MAWRAAKSLIVWHAQMKAKAPRAVKEMPGSVWGLKAGASHAQSGGHFPHTVPGIGTEIVTAADAPDVPRLGLDLHAELDAIRASRDPRVYYAISRDRMFSSYAAHGYPSFTWRPYNPDDPSRDRHNEHGHLQVVDDARADQTQPWATTTTAKGIEMYGFPSALDAEALMWRVEALVAGRETVAAGPTQGEPVAVVLALKRIETILKDADARTLPAGLTADDIRRIVRDEVRADTTDVLRAALNGVVLFPPNG